MISKEQAVLIQTSALAAIRSLSSILFELQHGCATEDFEVIKRGVGLSIGRIQMEVLEPVYKDYPELDHLKD